ncbi:hypothetical protein [Segatella copri]|uniref:hypothetical protein n=1 Tax=Segatella copri TaxID=165179 RepID=UPI001931F7EB|nr:hypothetical protein [Segatella copri]MBM0129093.1 hypothetical protein [Segatella copri]
MSEQKQVMALNPARKGNMGRINSLQPLAVYDQLIAQPWLKGLVEQIRGEKPMAGVDAANGKAAAKAREELKRQLPFRAIHYARFRNNHRSQGDADPESFLFQTTVDVDDKEYVEQALEKARELNCSDTIWKGKLLHLEYSARKKLHIDIRMPVGMTIEETQRAYCEASGIPYDKSCITPERIIFITDKDSEIYRSKEWYGVLPAEEISLRREAFVKRGLTIDGRGKQNFPQISQMPQIHSAGSENVNSNHNVQNSKFNVQSEDNRFSGTNGDNAVYAGTAVQPAQPVNSHRVNDSHLGSAGASQDAGGVATQNASEKNLIAFELFKEAAGLKGMEIDTIGSRHSSLLAIMSAGASRVMSEDELMKVVAKKMPSYYEERDCHQLIHDFYAKYGDSSKPFSRDVMRINATAEKQAAVYQVNSLQLKVESSTPNALNVQGDEVHYPDPPAMPTQLPKLVEHLISNTPDVYKPAVAHAIFPPLATHLWNTRFRYIDNVEHEATLATVLLASTGAGKSCVQKPIEYIMEDIRKRDAENLKREKEWKDEVVRKGANKDKRKRPDNLIIQEIDADMTNPAFVMRTAEAQGHFLYTSLNEIDLFDALKGNGGQQFRIMCLAFDPSNKYGQTRVGSQSVTDRVTIRFNWNASSTIQKGQRYFSKVLTDGPISRINFCTIPEREIGEEMPVYGTYDEAYREGLKPYIENLCQASGLVECEEAFQLALKLKEEHAEFSRLSQDRTYENLSFRANVIGYLKACVLYVANGYRWEPEIEEFIRWSEQYDLYCKMKFFGDAIKRANGSDEKTSKRGPASLLQQLPDVFSFQQAEFLRSQLGMNRSGTVSMLRNWVNRNYVKKIPPQGAKGDVISIQLFSFEKLRNRKDGKVVNMLNS